MRQNLALPTTESWRPPGLRGSNGIWASVVGGVRRFFDLQAASIWRDLTGILPKRTGPFLDVGCGAQPYKSLLGQESQYLSIDIEGSERLFGYRRPGVLYFQGEVWPIDSSSQDTVFASEVMEHVYRTGPFLSEARRCLKPGGKLILTVPFAARWHFIPEDYWRFTPSSLKNLLTEAGFSGLQIFARGNALTVASYKVVSLMASLFFRGRGLMRLATTLCGILLFPLLLVAAGFGQLSLWFAAGNDCLGYTVTADRL